MLRTVGHGRGNRRLPRSLGRGDARRWRGFYGGGRVATDSVANYVNVKHVFALAVVLRVLAQNFREG